MFEEPFYLTKTEAKYCLLIAGIAAEAGRGTDIGTKAEALIRQLEAEMEKPENLTVSINAEEKNNISLTMMIYELLIREKYDVLADHFNLRDIPVTAGNIQAAESKISDYSRSNHLDAGELQKKLQHRRKIPVRKLYIADLHFYHDNLNHRMDMRGFSGYEEMNAHMVRQWNDHVTKKDEVYILGDFAISRGRAANEILRQLNGKKFLVEGNHDRFLDDKEFDRSQFEWIRPYAEIQDSKRRVVLSHYPVFCYKGQYRTSPDGMPLTYMFYGHVHNTHDEQLVNEFIRITKQTMVTSRNQIQEHPIPCNMINCFCMFSNYIPLTLDDWIRLDEDRRTEMNRFKDPLVNRKAF